MEFTEYLDELSDGSRKLVVSRLQQLSALTADRVAELAARWPAIDVRRRRRLVQELNDLAEDNVDLDFAAVYRHALNDDDPDVRLAAVRGLWEDESPSLIEPLAALLDHDPSVAVRAEAALALGRFVLLASLGRLREHHFEKAEAALRRVVDNPAEDRDVRARALEAIGAHDSPWVRQAVREAYESGEHRLKVSAVHAMGRSAEPRWLPLLAKEMGSDDAELRYEAAVAAGSIGDEAAVPALVPLLTDDDVEVRTAAVMSLGEIGGPAAREALMAQLDSPSKADRDAASEALATIDFEEDPLGFKMRE